MKYLVVSILLFLQADAYSQIVSRILLSKDSMELGEQVDVLYFLEFRNPSVIQSVDYAAFDTIRPVVGMGSLVESEEQEADIDWSRNLPGKIPLDRNKVSKQGSKYVYIDTLKATIWDPGLYVINHPSVYLSDSTRASVQELEVSPLTVKFPQVVNQDTTKMILPIAPIIGEPRTWEDFIWILYIFIPLLLISLLLWYLKKRNEIPAPKLTTIIKKPAHVIANEKLEVLQSQALWKTGEIKKYQTELTYTIREYLESRFDINALESTTDQIIRSLNDKDFSITHENSLREILQIADLVKFAKANPPKDLHESFLNTAKSFVEDTKDPNSKEEVIVMDEHGNIIENNTEAENG